MTHLPLFYGMSDQNNSTRIQPSTKDPAVKVFRESAHHNTPGAEFKRSVNTAKKLYSVQRVIFCRLLFESG